MITPSHNPPEDGGFKYNPPNGGPADTDITSWIENAANESSRTKLDGVKRIPYERARKSAAHSSLTTMSAPMSPILPMSSTWTAIRAAGVKIGIDPLGGAGVHYWQPIIERYGLAATVVNDVVDPTFRFMTVDWDGKIRMDCSSPYAMARLIAMRDNSTSPSPTTPMPTVMASCRVERAGESQPLSGGRDRLSVREPPGLERGRGRQDRRLQRHHRPRRAQAGRKLVEVPVGSNGSSTGLIDGSLGFGGEESAGASFLRRDGTVWTTDKDGLILVCSRRKSPPTNGIRAKPMMADAGAGRARLRAHRCAGDGGAEEDTGEALARPGA